MPEPESEKRVKKEGMKTFCFTEAEVEPHSGDVEAERSGKGIWYPEEFDRDIWGYLRTGIACQAPSPGETPMCMLCTGHQSGTHIL